MDILCKVGDKYPVGHPNHTTGWRDGQIVEIREDGFFDGASMSRKNFCVIRVKGDFWQIRGTTDWKADTPQTRALKKYMSSADRNGKYRWESGYIEETLRERDFFIDFKDLLDRGLINRATYESIYDSTINHLPITLSTTDILQIRKDDRTDTKKPIDAVIR